MRKLLVCLSFLTILLLSQNLIAQDVILTANTSVNLYPSATLIFNNGAKLVNNCDAAKLSGNVIFSGPGELGIAGTKDTEFANLSLESGALVNLGVNIVVTGSLHLNAGILKLGNSNLTIPTGGSIAGVFSENVMIAADGAGKLVLGLSGNGTYLFPVGNISGTYNYSPAELSFNSGNYSNAKVSLNLKGSKHPSNTSTNHYLNRYWSVTQTGISNFSCDLKFRYLNEDVVGNEANIYGGKWNGSYWTSLNKVNLNEITGNVTGFSDFSGGELSVLSVEIPLSEQVSVDVFKNVITIKTLNSTRITALDVFNISGQRIYSADLGKSNTHQFELKSGSGIYLLRFTDGAQYYAQKIILN